MISIRIDFWCNAETTIIHQDLWLGKLVPSSQQRANLATQFSATSADEIRKIGEDISIPDSLGEETTFINICISNGGLKCL